MKKLLSFLKSNKDSKAKKVIEKELKENIKVIESLRDYDQGKKEISTSELEKRLSNVQNSL